MPPTHLKLVWQQQKKRGREGGREGESEREAHKTVLNAYNFMNTETQEAKIQVPNHHKKTGHCVLG